MLDSWVDGRMVRWMNRWMENGWMDTWVERKHKFAILDLINRTQTSRHIEGQTDGDRQTYMFGQREQMCE